MNEFTLTKENKSLLSDIHENFFKGRKRRKDLEVGIRYYDENNYMDCDINYFSLHLLAISYLKKSGYTNFDAGCIAFEFQRRNYSNFTTEKKLKDFVWHYDDYNAVSFKVYTIIFYLRKDITVRGGNLLYDLEESREKEIRKVEVDEGKVVVFPGNVYHSPEISYGLGCRESIVVFIKRLN